MLYALTDFLVVIGVAIAVWRSMIGAGYQQLEARRTAGKGLATFAFAALIGTIRFFELGDFRLFPNGEAALAAHHSWLSNYAAVSGLAFVMAGQAALLCRARLSRIATAVGLIVISMLGIFAQTAGLIAWLSAFPILWTSMGLGLAFYSVYRRSYRPALFWLASWLLLIFASTAIGGSREETTLGIANWHIYHALLAIWAILVGEAVRASTSTRA